jgi:ribonucleoside-diphosphate reductase alpha chain
MLDQNTAISSDPHELNAMLGLPDAAGNINFEADREAARAYVEGPVAAASRKWDSLADRLADLMGDKYYEPEVILAYNTEFLEKIWDHANNFGFHFTTFLGAFKFYTSYALKTRDGKTFLEGFEDRTVMCALTLARGDEDMAMHLVTEILSARFQPATPTFMNTGRVARGELVSCFLLRVEDNMESIARGITSSLQLSRRGGGVALNLSNLRELGAPIKGIEGRCAGVVPVMKQLEDAFAYADQLGARQSGGAVYLHAHHPDILRYLDTKRENADEKVRIKTLSLGVVIPDVTMEKARKGEKIALFSPHDVEKVTGKAFTELSITEHYDEFVADDRIKKSWTCARELFQIIAEIQCESGYPYIMYEDTVNNASALDGRITMSNLCSEILQPSTPSLFNADSSYAHVGTDISCNLGSQNVARVMDGGDIGNSVESAIRALTAVSELSSIEAVPSVLRANAEGRAIGLGQMNLHGYFGREQVHYGDADSVEFTSVYFATVAYHAMRASCLLAREKGATFAGFEKSAYADGTYFDKYIWQSWLPTRPRVIEMFAGHDLPTLEDWMQLKNDVMEYGLYNQNLQAVPPTGSISYINHATSSIHPITKKVETRKEGKLGRVYYPAPHLNNENGEFFKDAYELGPDALIDIYAAATTHVDQGLSCTMFFPASATTRTINKAQIRAWKKGIKTLYYVRIRQDALEGTEDQGCVACAL